MTLDSRHLQLVAEVARAESVTRAADRLHVTQSAVSHQLREIESRLGTALFVRAGRRMLPTAAGRQLAETAERVLAEIARAEAAVTRLARGVGVEFRVCTQCQTGYHWLPPLLTVLRQRSPGVEVRIAAEHTHNAIGALLDGRLDLAIVNRAPRDRRLRIQPLFRDEHAAIVHAAHPWAAKRFVTAHDLAGERLILYSHSLDDSFVVQRLLRPARLEPAAATFLQLTEAVVEMVKAGLGVSVLPTWSIAPALASGAVRAVRITRNGLFRDWSAATLAGLPPSPFVEHFVDVLARQGPGPGSAPARGRSAAKRVSRIDAQHAG